MKHGSNKSFWVKAIILSALLASAQAADAPASPLVIQFPKHTQKGTPEDSPIGSNVEPPSEKPPKPLDVPKGVTNVALGKKVTSSVAPFFGELSQITDGKREPIDEDAVEMKKGVHWVQVDLGATHEIHAIVMWHDHRILQVTKGVVLQVSDDPTFKSGVTTLYNNDVDNSSGLGVGTDREYFELEWGRAVPAKGVKARYVRGYTRGTTQTPVNAWQEIEVYALPAK